MIGLGTKLFDIDGDFVFYGKDIIIDDMSNMNASRRLSKVKTLDGGVFIDDSGYAPGDTDITITVINPPVEQYEKLKSIFIYHSFIYVMSRGGNLLCVPSSISIRNGNAVMTFSTKENA